MKSPKTLPLLPAVGGLLALTGAGLTQAQETQGRVVSSTPVVQQVVVPRQVCQNQTVTVPGQKSGAGALIGGIAGGAVGNAIGDGSGRALATAIGLVGGAVVGHRIEGGSPPQTQTVQQCSTQNFQENRVVAYNVVYEYAGRQYSTQMQHDPGPFVRLSITPVNAAPPPPVQFQPVQPRVEFVPAAPVVTRIHMGTTYVPPPHVIYIGGYRDAPAYHHPRRGWGERDDRHRRDRRDDEKWQRH